MSAATSLGEIFGSLRIVVLGDVMLDRFVYGDVQRISPEAPVPVLRKTRETNVLGGAGNVARNVAALSAAAILVGAVGDDATGQLIKALSAEDDRITDRLAVLPNYVTIEKTRYIAQQHLLRVDGEQVIPIVPEAIGPMLEMALDGAQALVLSDYAKGLLSPDVLHEAIAKARAVGIPVIADPKARDMSRYDGATVLTPNRHEAEAATGIHVDDDASAERAAREILRLAPSLHAVVLTRSEKGMTVMSRDSEALHLPATAREVFDVSGAGDTVAAVLALSLAAGKSLAESGHLANAAAGIVVGKLGTATVTTAELDHALTSACMHVLEDKILSREEATAVCTDWRGQGLRVGFANGCFDLLHPGHVSLLTQARAQCDRLVVGLNSDESVKRLKGPTRPVQNELARSVVLASLAAVDAVVVFGEKTPLELIQALRPEVLVKGSDYTIDKVVGAPEVQSWGGRVFLAELVPSHSTTGTITRMADRNGT